MDIQNFITLFGKAIEVEDLAVLTPETEFHDLDEWSSISVMVTIAFFDEEFDKQIDETTIREANTILDLFNIATA